MSKRTNINNDSKQPKLTAFIVSKSNETGMKKNRRILVDVLVNLKSRIGRQTTKAIYFVLAVPETETSSISSEIHSSTSAPVSAEGGLIDSTTVNVNVTLNITTDTEIAGK